MIRAIRRALAVLVSALFVGSAPVLGHHSGSIFDNSKSLTLTGTVKMFQWTNPHCFIQLLVPDGTASEEWSIEMGAPLQVYQAGWRPSTLKGGQKITVILHPMRDGSKAGLFVSATSEDGRPLGKQT